MKDIISRMPASDWDAIVQNDPLISNAAEDKSHDA